MAFVGFILTVLCVILWRKPGLLEFLLFITVLGIAHLTR